MQDLLDITLAEDPIARTAQLGALYDETTANIVLAQKRLNASVSGIRFLQQQGGTASLAAAVATVTSLADNLFEIAARLKADRAEFLADAATVVTEISG